MKRVLIAGKDSYIGVHISSWLDATGYLCETLDMRTNDWKKHDFSVYDSVVLVAGIAHQRETKENAALYEQVNYRLAMETAKKAKQAQVNQFVFFSTMSVYGLTVGTIHSNTELNPNSVYGKTKLQAEQAILTMESESFHVAILRPPMIYGNGCKGNYNRLSRLVLAFRVLPKVKNQRSMLYIETLCAFMENLIESGKGGLYFPQNPEYVSTTNLAAAIAKAHKKRIIQPAGMAWLLKLLENKVSTIGKVFGSLTYDQSMSQALMPKETIPFDETILRSEATE